MSCMRQLPQNIRNVLTFRVTPVHNKDCHKEFRTSERWHYPETETNFPFYHISYTRKTFYWWFVTLVFALNRLLFWESCLIPQQHTHTHFHLLAHADFTVFWRYPQGTQEWFGATTHPVTPKNAPEHRAHVAWNISEAQVERPTERKVTSIFRLTFFLAEHGMHQQCVFARGFMPLECTIPFVGLWIRIA